MTNTLVLRYYKLSQPRVLKIDLLDYINNRVLL